MAKATTTINFADGDQVTSTKLDQIIGGFALGADSADGTTITINGSGVISLGTVTAANMGANAVTTNTILDANVTAAKLATDAVETAKIKDLNVTGAKVAEETLGYSKTLVADRAVKADMQSETTLHFVAPDVLKYHPGIAKAYGTVSLASGVTTITGGYNVTSAIDTGTGRQITLSVTMADTNYQVLVTYKDTGAVANSVAYSVDSATQFTLQAGAEAAGRAVTFIIFGQLA